MGKYSTIRISVSEAQPGDSASLVVAVTNISEFTIYVEPVVRVNGEGLPHNEKTITPGQEVTWTSIFVMPEKLKVTAESWLESYEVDWHRDAITTYSKGVSIMPLLAGGLLAGVVILGISRK